eukprot:Trichotokara_eunicae@DN2012_c0_g1_i2.p1
MGETGAVLPTPRAAGQKWHAHNGTPSTEEDGDEGEDDWAWLECSSESSGSHQLQDGNDIEGDLEGKSGLRRGTKRERAGVARQTSETLDCFPQSVRRGVLHEDTLDLDASLINSFASQESVPTPKPFRATRLSMDLPFEATSHVGSAEGMLSSAAPWFGLEVSPALQQRLLTGDAWDELVAPSQECPTQSFDAENEEEAPKRRRRVETKPKCFEVVRDFVAMAVQNEKSMIPDE